LGPLSWERKKNWDRGAPRTAWGDSGKGRREAPRQSREHIGDPSPPEVVGKARDETTQKERKREKEELTHNSRLVRIQKGNFPSIR